MLRLHFMGCLLESQITERDYAIPCIGFQYEEAFMAAILHAVNYDRNARKLPCITVEDIDPAIIQSVPEVDRTLPAPYRYIVLRPESELYAHRR